MKFRKYSAALMAAAMLTVSTPAAGVVSDALSVTASADDVDLDSLPEEVERGDLVYVLIEDHGINPRYYVKCKPDSVKTIKKASILSEMYGLPVTTIAQKAFYQCVNLEEVEIPDSITDIGYAAFATCKKLKKINIPKSVKEYSGSCFEYCDSLEEITVSPGNENFFAFKGALYERKKAV